MDYDRVLKDKYGLEFKEGLSDEDKVTVLKILDYHGWSVSSFISVLKENGGKTI